MNTISLEKHKQKNLIEKVENIKRKLKSKEIVLLEKVKRKPKKKRKFYRKPRATIYISHIPHGFYEEQMFSYFSQFGKVFSAKVARSKKTGRSRGFGFVEFQNEEVAKIAAETMDNYLLCNKVLKCKYIPPDENKMKNILKIDPSNFPKKINRSSEFKSKNLAYENLKQKKYQAKILKKASQISEFLKNKGINFSLQLQTNAIEEDKNNLINESKELNASKPEILNKAVSEQDKVLEIDESDNDIQFKTPPNVKKIIRKSNVSSTPKNSRKKIIKKNKKVFKKS